METAAASRPVARPVDMVDLDDLHAADADRILADALEHAIGPVALTAHLLRPSAADLLA
jgi:hypothetical protein